MSNVDRKQIPPVLLMMVGMFIAPPLLALFLVWIKSSVLVVAGPLMLGVLATRIVFEPGSNRRGLLVILYVIPATAVLIAILFGGACAFRGECL